MTQPGQVPPSTVQRLPLYLRCLVQAQSQRLALINSEKIAQMAGTNAAQVRKDMSYLGEYGTRGLGYDVDGLIVHLTRWLGLEKSRRAAIVGFGRLGSALRSYAGFQDRGVSIVAVFDSDPDKIGTSTDGLRIESIKDVTSVASDLDIEIAILTVPASAAQSAAQSLVDAGVKAILNFAPVKLDVPDDVVVRQADVAAELQILSFHLGELGRNGEPDGDAE